MSTLTGKTIGKYTLTERLGRGAMAEVYKAYHPKLGRTVAVKIMHGYLAEGEDFLKRFEREARALAALRHPHIVQIHDFDVEQDNYYLVIEYFDGGTLQDRMAELARIGKFMPLGQVLEILKQIGEALDYAHQKGIIHRDIKPSNILLNTSGEAFLGDFGIARMVSSTQFTSTGSLIGTPTYMSPEQCKGLEITAASDIYSLGVILYELLTGRAPFLADTPLALIQKHVSEPLPLPGVLRPGLPPSVEAVVRKALAKDPVERYQSAGELAQALKQALPEDVVARLDQVEVGKTTSTMDQPTELMEAGDLPGRTQQPTMAIGDETRAEIAGIPPAIQAARLEPSGFKKTAEQEGKPTPPTQEQKPERHEKPAAAEGKKRSMSRLILFGVIGVVLVGILVLVITNLPGGVSCSSVEDCFLRANPLRDQGDLEGYLEYIGAAIDQVPADQHPRYAGLWCDRGDVERQLGQLDEAIRSYTSCIDWTQGDPDLQPLRDRAGMALDGLR